MNVGVLDKKDRDILDRLEEQGPEGIWFLAKCIRLLADATSDQTPRIGAWLFYFPGVRFDKGFRVSDEIMSATIVHLNDDGTVNLTALKGDGGPLACLSIPIRETPDECNRPRCWWRQS